MQWVSTKFSFVSSFVDHNIEEALDRPDRDRAPARDVDYIIVHSPLGPPCVSTAEEILVSLPCHDHCAT